MPGLRAQHWQVLLTYYRRPAFRLLALAALASMALFLGYLSAKAEGFELPFRYSATGQILMLVTFLVVFSPVVLLITFTAILVWHVREQLALSGADIIPGLRNANLNVAAAVFLCVPLVAAIACWEGDQLILMRQLHRAVYGTVPYGLYFRMKQSDTTFALGVFAIALTLMSSTALWASSRSPWLSLLMIPLFLLAITWQPMATFMDHLVSPAFSGDDSNRLHALEIIVANVVLLVALRAKLSRSRPSRRFRWLFAIAARGRSQEISWRPHRMVTAALARVWHRRYGVLNPLAPWAVAGILAVLLLCVPLVVGVHQADLLRSLLLPTLVPGVVISAIWRERWLNLGYESLYPARRSQFVSELAVATAINLAELWVATTLAVLPATLVWQPRVVFSPTFSVTLASSAAMQVLVFGVMFATALFRPLLPYINIVTILSMLVPISLAWAQEPLLSSHGLLLVSTIEMVVGLMLSAWAASAWRRADLA